MDITTDPGGSRTMNSDMVFGSSPGSVNTVALGDSSGHSDQHSPGGDMALGHTHGHRVLPVIGFYLYLRQEISTVFTPKECVLGYGMLLAAETSQNINNVLRMPNSVVRGCPCQVSLC